jgi:hypothetical protein
MRALMMPTVVEHMLIRHKNGWFSGRFFLLA